MATIRLGSTALLAVLVAGCVSPAPRFDARFGESVRANLAAQVSNPAASANPSQVRGIDGRAARGAQERYEKSFAQPEVAPPALISVMGK